MDLNNSIPFYSNTPDDTHCYQAALKMVLKHFKPKEEFSWQELEKLTAKVEGLWTWPTQGLINLNNMGFEIVDIDDFNIEKFIEDGENYLTKKYGKEVGKAQILHSNIRQEQDIYKDYLKLNLHDQRIPSTKDIKKLIHEGYLIVCNVNAETLNSKSGYAGHFVVIFGYDEIFFHLHDPGLPPLQDRKVSYRDFNKAWGYPDESSKNLQAFKLKAALNFS